MTEQANIAQTKLVGEQLFAIWEARQGEKTTRWQGSVPAWVACILSITAVVWQAAVTTGNVSENRRRIEATEIKLEAQASDSRGVIDRLARIEAKLDLIGGDRNGK